MASDLKGLPNFVRLEGNISLCRPATGSDGSSNPSTDEAPLIVLCAWFRAVPKHIAKYTTRYQDLYPHAQILLIESVVGDMLYTPYQVQRSRLKPAIDVLLAAQAEGRKCFLHVFSNGGGNNAAQLAEAWRARQGTPLPLQAMALDSCPGSPSLRLAGEAIIQSFPPSARWWAPMMVWAVIIPIFAFPLLLGRPNAIATMRTSLNNVELFKLETPRLYLYSDADRLVWPSDVNEHFTSAREAGYSVEVAHFLKSSHVAHVSEDSDLYWRSIADIQCG